MSHVDLLYFTSSKTSIGTSCVPYALLDRTTILSFCLIVAWYSCFLYSCKVCNMILSFFIISYEPLWCFKVCGFNLAARSLQESYRREKHPTLSLGTKFQNKSMQLVPATSPGDKLSKNLVAGTKRSACELFREFKLVWIRFGTHKGTSPHD